MSFEDQTTLPPPAAAELSLLLIDGDETHRHALAERLTADDCRVREAPGVLEAYQALGEAAWSAVVCDLPPSAEQGRRVLQDLLSAPGRPAVILLGPQDELVDRLIGLELGADDYMCRPVNPRELRARVNAVLRGRRPKPVEPANDDQPGETYVFAGFELNADAEVLIGPDGGLVAIPRAEYLALLSLIRSPGSIVSRTRLQGLSSPHGVTETSRAVDLRVSRLRRRLQQAGAVGEIIQTYYGRGYFFRAQVEAGGCAMEV